ncbi:MAG TPA: hypothetical protein VNI20_06320 [Fimbriimonadaceae bacterium]|nr:hypothetical protein [Fimbriimonadaceae bacterium]
MQPVITHIATKGGIRSFVNTNARGQGLGYPVQSVLYSDLLKRESWPRGLYLFCDMERATPWQRALGAHLWRRLNEQPEVFRTLNHPTNHMRRFELLRRLYEREINGFNVYRLSELPAPVRYPAFVRYEDRHIGPSSGLLQTQAELEDKLAQLIGEGHPPERLIVCEFQDTSDSSGVFRKFGAFRIGDHIQAGHMMAGADWSLKSKCNDRRIACHEDLEYVKANPHAAQVREIFEICGLEWGRMDYGVSNGKIQVWEINDNPKLGSKWYRRSLGRGEARRISRASRRLGFARAMRGLEPGPPVSLRLATNWVWKSLGVRKETDEPVVG